MKKKIAILIAFVMMVAAFGFIGMKADATTGTKMTSAKPTAKQLAKLLIGKWSNDQGEALIVTKSNFSSKQLISDGDYSQMSSKYKVTGLDKKLPNAIKINVGDSRMSFPAEVQFEDENHIYFTYIGDGRVSELWRQ